MLVSVIRTSIAYNLRRVAVCVISRKKTKIACYCNESNLLSTSIPLFAAGRIYSTERDSQQHVTLPKLVQEAPVQIPSLITPLKLLYLSVFKIAPYIDKEFNAADVLEGAKHASIIISKALTNKDFESLQGLVSEDMIEVLSKKIEILSPNERQLIELNNDDIMFYVLSDIAVATASNGSEHSIEIATTCHYMPGLSEIRNKLLGEKFEDLKKNSESYKFLACNYRFTRNYVNNVGGPWIATLVNHFSMS